VKQFGATVTAKDTLESFYQAVSSGDVPAVLGLLDDNVEWTEAAGFPYAGTYHGLQAVLDGVFTRVAGEWDEYRTEPSHLVAEGEEVISFGTYSGTYKATGKSFSARFAHSVTVKDSKIVRFEQVVDTAEVNKAL
jgi:uncharacterized protein